MNLVKFASQLFNRVNLARAKCLRTQARALKTTDFTPSPLSLPAYRACEAGGENIGSLSRGEMSIVLRKFCLGSIDPGVSENLQEFIS